MYSVKKYEMHIFYIMTRQKAEMKVCYHTTSFLSFFMPERRIEITFV